MFVRAVCGILRHRPEEHQNVNYFHIGRLIYYERPTLMTATVEISMRVFLKFKVFIPGCICRGSGFYSLYKMAESLMKSRKTVDGFDLSDGWRTY